MKEFHFSDEIRQATENLLQKIGLTGNHLDIWDRTLVFIVIIAIGIVVHVILIRMVVPLLDRLFKPKSHKLSLYFFKKHFLRRLMGIFPPLVVLFLLPIAFSEGYEEIYTFLKLVSYIYLLIVTGMILSTGLDVLFEYYQERNTVVTKPYKPLVEMGKISIWGVLTLMIISLLMNIPLTHVITGLSAFIAILILVFRSTLLGFVAGIQLAYNNMISIGDWVVVPDSEANGVVTDINILTVRIQNFDNTFVYVPAYNLVTNPFKNWSGMYNSGVWRVNDTYLIDVTTIRATDSQFIDTLLADAFVKEKLGESGFATLQSELKGDADHPLTSDLQSNLGIFRRWVELFLTNRPEVTTQPYLLVFEQGSQGTGISLQLLFFIKTTDWLKGYHMRTLILEQLTNSMTHFGLRQFQFDRWENAPQNPMMNKVEGTK
ncbi:MAG: mechanosensitive ion channel [Bacteroidales bacterium]